MNSARACLAAAVGLIFNAQVVSAQDSFGYRTYVLESSLESVVTASRARAADAKTLHERPARIQELEWRAPYVSSGSEEADPVRHLTFSFIDDALFQILVSYDPDRTDGLTNNDLIQSLSATYGAPVSRSAKRRPAAALPDSVVLAQWEKGASSLTLLRGAYSSEFHLLLISNPLAARARTSMREAIRLDAIEAPRRELEQRKKEVVDASAARDKTRKTNKAAFRP